MFIKEKGSLGVEWIGVLQDRIHTHMVCWTG